MLSSTLRRAIVLSILLVAGTIAAAAAGLDTPAERIADRSYPSVFEAWNPAENLNANSSGAKVPLSSVEDPVTTLARHDLAFVNWAGFGLKSPERSPLAMQFTPESVQEALRKRAALLAINPHLILLVAVTYANTSDRHPDLPESSQWWKRDASGQRVPAFGQTKYGHQFMLDFANPDFQVHVAEQCRTLVATGVFDGCMLDGWHEENPGDPVDPIGSYRLQLIEKMRASIGAGALLLANTNGTLPAKTAPYLNGMYMEGFGASYFSDWKKATSNLLWAAGHLRKPVITAFEEFYAHSRDDLALMHQATTLALTFSNGYVLFGSPNYSHEPDHSHDWYPFWDKSLGRPVGPLGEKGPSGSFRREFEKGTVVFNPPSNQPVKVHFNEVRSSEATGSQSRDYEVEPGDGDIFIKAK